MLLVLRKLTKVLALNPPPVQRQQSSQTNTSLQTRFSSCGTSPTISTRKLLLVCFRVSKDLWRQDWYPGERESPSSNMRLNRGLSVPKRIPLECQWARLASLFGLHTRDSSERGLDTAGHCEPVMAFGMIVSLYME